MTKFHERFDINIDIDEARKRFVNRAHNLIFDSFLKSFDEWTMYAIEKEILTILGDKHLSQFENFTSRIGEDFYRNLRTLEAFYQALLGSIIRHRISHLEYLIDRLIEDSEIDLDIKWEGGRFVR